MATFQRRTPLGIIPHDALLRITAAAELSHFQHYPNVRVAGFKAFQEMKAYIAKIHSGIDAVHSYEDGSGQIFDCIPIEQQIGLRGNTKPIPAPPDLRLEGGARASGSLPAARPMATAPRDRHGNPQQAPAGTIPVRRVTLEDLIRFEDLDSFFRKHPSTVVASAPIARPSLPDPDSTKNHRYAVGYEQVDNIGGHGFISVYAPTVNNNETFSLAQHWYSGGSGSNLQTVEIGWQVFPQMYGHANPVLFIYWTSAAYANGSGAYNLDSPGFVQVNSNIAIGGARSPVSTAGGAQNEMEIAAYFTSDGWWLYVDGLSSDNALGYYPISLFGSGQMASGADTIEYGGETVSGNPPSGDWGPMGSGAYGEKGWQQSAYQRYIYYYMAGGGSQWATLNVVQPVSACYSFAGGFDPTNWGTYFFFGGPGGGDC